MKMFTNFKKIPTFLIAFAVASAVCFAQDRPYKVYDTRPVVLYGPYLTSPSVDGISVVWITDTPCHSKVIWGEGEPLKKVAEPQEHGMVPVDTLHSVRLTGLAPGVRYQYKVVSTRVVRLKPYWPDKGRSVESGVYSFELPGSRAETVSFSFITDTQHEDLQRLKDHLDLVDWDRSDFLVHGGDALSWVEDEQQLMDKFLRPVTGRLGHSKALVFVRGNHDLRGAFARSVFEYVPTGTGQFYYAFDAGPVHLIVLDTCEDKEDSRSVYADLNRCEVYREQEFRWLEHHIESSSRLKEAPFRVVLLHNPSFGWVPDTEKWTTLADRAGVDLVIAGHRHRYSLTPPGESNSRFYTVVVGQDQVGFLEADESRLQFTVTDGSEEPVDTLIIPRRR